MLVFEKYMKQYSLFKLQSPQHGGTLRQGKSKTLRPLCTKRVIHLTLKASKNNFYAHKREVEKELRRLASRFKIKIYSNATNWDHLHLAIKIPDRKSYISFIRAFTGLMAKKFGKKLWTALPHTRLVSWGKAFKKLLQYIDLNKREASGEILYTPRQARHRGMLWIAIPP